MFRLLHLKYLFVAISVATIFGCSTKLPEPYYPPDDIDSYEVTHKILLETDPADANLDTRLKLNTNSKSDTDEFKTEKKEYLEKHIELAKGYLAWRKENSSSFEDFDFYSFMFQQFTDGLLFPNNYEYEHTLAVAEKVEELDSKVILFTLAYDKDEFKKRLEDIFDQSAFPGPPFDHTSLRQSIFYSQNEFSDLNWCEVLTPINIELDDDKETFVPEEIPKKHMIISFTQQISSFETEKMKVFNLIAKTRIGNKLLRAFLRKTKEEGIKIVYEKIIPDLIIEAADLAKLIEDEKEELAEIKSSQATGGKNNEELENKIAKDEKKLEKLKKDIEKLDEKETFTAGQWSEKDKKISLNAESIWTYGRMASILLHEIVHALDRDSDERDQFENLSREIKDIEDRIEDRGAELTKIEKNKEPNSAEIKSRRAIQNRIEGYEARLEALKLQKKELRNVRELRAFSAQYTFSRELYHDPDADLITPCTLLYYRVVDLEGTNKMADIVRRYQNLPQN